MTQVFLGNPSSRIQTWMRANTPVPSPYFTYDSNRVITGFVQGSPNVLQEGTYNGWSEEQGDYADIPYSEYAPPQPFALNDEYALGVGNGVFNCYSYSGYDTASPPIDRTVTSINLPNATSIGADAFSINYGVSTVNIQNVTSIGNNAFYYCEDITSISIPNVTSIGYQAFNGCFALASISLPNVTSIGSYAFGSCNNLTSVTIGSSIETIGEGAFSTWGNPMTLTIGKPISWVETRYSNWGLPSGSTIICTGDDTIGIE